MSRSRVTLATIEAAAIAALFVSPSTTAMCGGASGPSRNPSTRHASAGGCRSASTTRRPQRFERCSPRRSISRDGMTRTEIRGAAGEDGVVEPLALLGLDLLRVVQERQRPDPVTAERGVVEQHARDDERPRERAAPGLVRPRDEPHVEPAVEAEESLTVETGTARG